MLIKCHAGCSTDQVVEAVGLTLADLFARERRTEYVGKKIVYPIREVGGEVVALHERIESANGKKKFVWRLPGTTELGLGGLPVADLPLYGSEQLADLPAGSTVIVVEGEKAADVLRSLGFTALGTVTGAGVTPSPKVLRSLIRFDLVLWPDNDGAGREHMDRIARILGELGGAQ